MSGGAGVRRVVTRVALLGALGWSVVGCANSSCGDRGPFDGVVFIGTVKDVSAEGRVTLHVESVESVADAGTIPKPEVFGVTTPAAPTRVLLDVAPGATVTVQFPKEQVDHLRRDIAKRYQVAAYPTEERSQLAAELQNMDHPCGLTTAAAD